MRKEPTFDAPKAPASETASVADRDAEPDAQALDIAALDEMAGRREPTFDAPAARAMTPEAGVEAPDEVVAPLRAETCCGRSARPDDPRRDR